MNRLPLLVLLLVACRTTEPTGPPLESPVFLGNPACPMSGAPIDPESFFEHEGQRVYFCNPKCARDGSLEPERFIAAAYPAARPVGNASCPVCEEPVADTTVTWQGRSISLCSVGCRKAFRLDAGKSARKALASQ